MFEFLEHILSIAVDIINSLGYWGIALGMLIESACIPLPSEVVLPLGGNMVNEGIITMFQANVAVNVGSMIGSLLAYVVGYYGGRPFILKYGKYFFISEKHFYQAEEVFRKHGVAAVFFGRLLPVIRTFISLPAGIARMDVVKFSVYSLIGMIPWNFGLIYLGFWFGDRYETVVRPMFKKFEYGFIAVLVLIIVAVGVKIYMNSKKKVVK